MGANVTMTIPELLLEYTRLDWYLTNAPTMPPDVRTRVRAQRDQFRERITAEYRTKTHLYRSLRDALGRLIDGNEVIPMTYPTADQVP